MGPGTYSGVLVTWTDVADETGYYVFRDGTTIITLDPDVASFLDLTLTGPGNHIYCVESFNASGSSLPCCGNIVIGVPPISVATKHWYNDCFPTSNTTVPGTPAFDREPARIKTGSNAFPFTGSASRLVIPGDTLVASSGASRLDLVFRIKPGPGNYVIVGNCMSGLRQNPLAPAVAVPGDASFWGQYLADDGAVGTGGNGISGIPHPGGVWSPHVWNSARCDTAEENVWRYDRDGPGGNPDPNYPALSPGLWASMYHEQDPKFSVLGITKRRCFAIDPTLPPTQPNLTCGDPVASPCAPASCPSPSYPPCWATTPACWVWGNPGFNPAEIVGSPGYSREYTKIIPDDLLTPGSHVEYFLRASNAGAPAVPTAFDPDTNRVVPQMGSSLDGERWEHFGVLPDRWKDPAFPFACGAGTGVACMLVVDYDGGGGNERVWAGVADSIGATAAARRGANTGWAFVSPGADPNNPAYFVRAHVGHPGTTWDYFKVRGARDTLTGNAGSLGSRLAPPAVALPALGRESRLGPSALMLRTIYREILILTGDRNLQILGPVNDRGQNDVGILEDFLVINSGTPQPRGLFVVGSGFTESEDATHQPFLAGRLGVLLRNPSYAGFSGNAAPGAALTVTDGPGTGTYGLVNGGATSLDVLDLSPATPEASAVSFYENFGFPSPYIASVYKPSVPARNWITMVDGWDIKDLGSLANANSFGRLVYFHDALFNIFGPLCPVAGALVGVSGLGQDASQTEFMSLRNNPLMSGATTVHFALARADLVHVEVYDSTGRRVRTLAVGAFEAGEHDVTWDGRDASSRPVGVGIYMARVQCTRSGVWDAKKIAVLR